MNYITKRNVTVRAYKPARGDWKPENRIEVQKKLQAIFGDDVVITLKEPDRRYENDPRTKSYVEVAGRSVSLHTCDYIVRVTENGTDRVFELDALLFETFFEETAEGE